MVVMMPIIAFAQSDKNAENQEVQVTNQPTEEPMVQPTIEPEEVEEETYGPLTPDGNLSLVDDYGSIEAGGKQFITVVTKSGNYFYIIIDRDEQGEETVHFLNMVDESDLLKLMDDEEAKTYVESIAEAEATPTEAAENTAKEEESINTEKEDSTTEKKSSSTGILVLILLVTIGGIGGYIFLKGSKKKNTKTIGPDPDADYMDDEEDYLADLVDDSDEELGYEEETSNDVEGEK